MKPRPAPLRLTDGSYLIRRAMEEAVATALESAAADTPDRGDTLILDIGGRGKPYGGMVARLLAVGGHGIKHVVIDSGPDADLRAAAEALPVADARADVILCTQMLEHVADPKAAVIEMARVLRPGGRCILTTHGTWFYHPDPDDLWRWTSAGLRRVFIEAGFVGITVRPVGGTLLALVALTLTALDHRVGEGLFGWLTRRVLIAPVNVLMARLTLARAARRESQSGELAINYLVCATRPAEVGPTEVRAR